MNPIPQKIRVNAETFFNLLKVLAKIESIVSDDFCHDATFELYQNSLTTEKEKTMAKKLSDIYKYSHAFNSKCPHPDWEEEALK